MPIKNYFSLVDTMARMALRADATRFFLGYIWWILEPLLYVTVFYLVFSIILDSGRADFLIFLMCGKFPFIWFSKSVNQASNSLLANVGLIGKLNVPKTIFPMAVIHEGLYKQAAVFVLLFIILFLDGYPPSWVWFWLLPLIFINYLLIVACSFVGSCLVCFVRDFSLIIGLAMIFLLFTSGIFWDVRALNDPDMTELILMVNPLSFVVDAYRQILMYGNRPDLMHLTLIGFGTSGVIFIMKELMRRGSQLLSRRALTA